MIAPELCAEIAERALCAVGTRADWQRIFGKKTISLGFIGGSVTQGYRDSHLLEDAYPAVTAQLLQKLGYTVKCTVCAEAGMDTLAGNVLADSVIVPQEPDIVVLEFAINETTLQHSILSFESLLRRMLALPSQPAVCVLMMRSASDYSCESFMRPMAEHYGVSCISIREGLNPALEAGQLQWEDFADREGHPNEEGHRLLAACIMRLLQAARAKTVYQPAPLPEPWLDAPFTALQTLLPGQTAQMIDTRSEVVPRNEWYFRSAWKIDKESGSFTLRAQCKTVILFFETDKSQEYGACRLTLDGKPMRHPLMNGALLSGYSLYGWGNPRSIILFNQEQAEEHTLVLEPTDGTFYLLACSVQ